MRREVFVNDSYYHICTRGVDKRQIFMDNRDYLRFLHNFYEFNDTAFAMPYMARIKGSDAGSTLIHNKEKGQKIVEVSCFCLMPNHCHLVLKQLTENGISSFMKKLIGGYASYFNKRYDRSGALFQGRFKAKLIKTDSQMMHLARYIHILNPGELVEPEIRKGVIRDSLKLKLFLKNYKWSSHLDYLGIKNYPSLTNRDFIRSYFDDILDYEKFMMSWKVNDLTRIESILIK